MAGPREAAGGATPTVRHMMESESADAMRRTFLNVAPKKELSGKPPRGEE